MEFRKLGRSEIKVSAICLGTMTWGEQNTLAEAHSQLDMAIDYGVNFIDTAEMYPVPPRAETCGKTEEFIGKWKRLKELRSKIILASKIVGPADFTSYFRDGHPRFDKKQLSLALEKSLQKLNTDYLDLYQLHWPERQTNFFGMRGYKHVSDNIGTAFEEILDSLKAFQDQGKIRHIGLSNETPWGVMKYLSLEKYENKIAMQSIQNPYNLLNRTYEIGLAEISMREKIGLLAYSPLAFGTLSGKYLNGKMPEGARLTKWKRFARYTTEQGKLATARYCQLALQYGMNPSQMALAFVTSRPFVTSNIIGATNLEQLKLNLESSTLKLSSEVLAEIEKIHQEIPDPCP